VLATLQSLSDQLRCLEIEVCKSTIKNTTKFEELIADSKVAQEVVTDHRDELHNEVARHLLNQNTAKRGFITWLKPNYSPGCLTPEPLNLMPALKYLIDNEKYDSTGYDVYDIFGEPLDVQCMKIMTLLTSNNLDVDRKPCTLALASFSKLKRLFWVNGNHSSVDYTPFVKSTNEIVATAQMVIQDVISKRIKTSNTTGTSAIIYIIIVIHIKYYHLYFIIVLIILLLILL
jgi:hypothetical protein